MESINKLLDRQESLVRKARDRAGALAHGLKTPLTVLTGEVRRLEMKGLASEAERMQEQLVSIGTHVDREVARARTSGTSVGCGAYTEVNETVGRLLRLMYRLPRGDRLNWQTEIPAGLAVDMDPHDFGEVIGNLLDNARKWAANNVTIRADRFRRSGPPEHRRRWSRLCRRTRFWPSGAGRRPSFRQDVERPRPWHRRGHPR